MKSIYKSTILMVFLLFTWNASKATHIAGQDISYTCVGQDSFLVTINLYRNCSGIAAPANLTANFNSACGSSFTALLTQTGGGTGTEVSQLCPTSLSSSTCNGGVNPGLMLHTYSAVVVLSPCFSWTASYSTCCRNSSANLVGQQGIYLSADLNNDNGSCNSSPIFTSRPNPYFCINQQGYYNIGAAEPDGDSLVYSLVSPLTAASTSVNYNAGYTAAAPIPGITINSETGELSFTPTVLGYFAMAIKISEYEYGTGAYKGSNMVDFQIIVVNCGTNYQPTVPGISNVTGNASVINSKTLGVCGNNNLTFDIVFTDANTADTVTLASNLGNIIPNANITMTAGNPATMHVDWTPGPNAPNKVNFVVVGSDDNCPLIGENYGTYTIIVNKGVATIPDDTICAGSQWVDLTTSGGFNYTWSVISGSPIDTVVGSSTYNMSCVHCESPSVSPQTTTVYQVASTGVGLCQVVDTVTITVAPNFDLTMPDDTVLCSIASYPLNITTTEPSFTYSYHWTPSTGLNSDTIASPIATPAQNTTYLLTMTSSAGCTKTGDVTVGLSAPFPSNSYITGDTVLCSGQSTQLEVHLGDIDITTCGTSNNGCLGNIQNGDIGTATTTNSWNTYPAVYGISNSGAKHQIIYTASELQALGMSLGGSINTISFYNNLVSGNVTANNFRVKMGCTSQSDLTNGWITGLQEVVGPTTHTMTTGWNHHSLTIPYLWDGTSNLVVEVSFENANGFFNSNAQTRFTALAASRVLYFADNVQGVSQHYPAIGTGTGDAKLSTYRPNTKFNFCSGTNPAAFSFNWTPSAGLSGTTISNPTAAPGISTTYQVVISDTLGGCSDTITHFVDVVSQFDAGFNFDDPICVNESPITLAPNVAGGVFTGSGVTSSGVFDPSIAGAGTWPITYSISSPTLCANDSTMLIQVLPLSNTAITYVEICEGSGAVNLTAATAGGTWGGAQITDSVNGVFDATGLSAGYYPVTYTITQPCSSTDTMNIKVIEPYDFTFSQNQINVCQDATINLSNNYVLSNGANQGSGPVTAVWTDVNGYISSSGTFDATGVPVGNYTVTLSVSGTNGTCGTSKDMVVNVFKTDYPTFPNSMSYCDASTNAVIHVNPWLYGNGTGYIQSPLSPLSPNDTLNIQPFGSNGEFNPSIIGAGSWELTVYYTNLNGCTGISKDTIHVLATPGNGVTLSGSTLTANASGAYTYQWFDCNNGNAPISGATNQSFTPMVSGTYGVSITAGNCVSTSTCTDVTIVGVAELQNDLGVMLYPNPVSDVLKIDRGQNEKLSVEITNSSGKQMYKTVVKEQVMKLDVSDYAAGVYFVKVSNDINSQIVRIVKM